MEKVIGSTPIDDRRGQCRLAALLRPLDEVPAVLADLAVHADLAGALDLAAVRGDVPAQFGVFHEDCPGGDVGAGVARIGLQPGELQQVGIACERDDFLHRSAIAPDIAGRDARPAAIGTEPGREVLPRGPVQVAVTGCDVRHAVGKGLGQPARVEIAEDRPVQPAPARLYPVDEKCGSGVIPQLLDHPVCEPGGLEPVLVHRGDSQEAAMRIQGSDVIPEGIEGTGW